MLIRQNSANWLSEAFCEEALTKLVKMAVVGSVIKAADHSTLILLLCQNQFGCFRKKCDFIFFADIANGIYMKRVFLRIID